MQKVKFTARKLIIGISCKFIMHISADYDLFTRKVIIFIIFAFFINYLITFTIKKCISV